MKILITGSSGMLGAELCGRLKQSYEVVGIDVSSPQSADLSPKKFYDLDITNSDQIKNVFEKEKPDIVIHAAAWTDVDGCEKDPDKADRINSKGTLAIADAAQNINAGLIYISTDFVFDGKKKLPYEESDEPNPISVYGKSKLDGEKHVIEKLDKYCLIRTSWLYGLYGNNFVDTIIRKAKNDKNLSVVNDQKGSPTYVKDLSLGIADVLNSGNLTKEIYHFSNKGECSWYEFAMAILELINVGRTRLEAITSKDIARAASRPMFSVLDCSKIDRILKIPRRSWKEALSEYIKKEVFVQY